MHESHLIPKTPGLQLHTPNSLQLSLREPCGLQSQAKRERQAAKILDLQLHTFSLCTTVFNISSELRIYTIGNPRKLWYFYHEVEIWITGVTNFLRARMFSGSHFCVFFPPSVSRQEIWSFPESSQIKYRIPRIPFTPCKIWGKKEKKLT